MGLTQGGCLYNAPFFKLDSVDDLPESLYQWTLTNYPDYLHPPKNYSTPNLTSWRVFKKIIDERRKNGEDDIQVPEQPEMSDTKSPNFDASTFDSLAELGWITAAFQGSSFYTFGERDIIMSLRLIILFAINFMDSLKLKSNVY